MSDIALSPGSGAGTTSDSGAGVGVVATAPVAGARGALWLFIAELGTIAVLATVADQGPGEAKIAVSLLVVLWVIFLILHSADVRSVLGSLGAGKAVM